MHITLCGSIAFYEEMRQVRKALELRGHEVRLPPATVPDEQGVQIPVEKYYALRKAADDTARWIWDLKASAMRDHFEKVAWSDAIVVVNPEKNGVPGYIGSNTFLEIGLAFWLKRPIYLCYAIPLLPCREELLAMAPIVINNDFSLIQL